MKRIIDPALIVTKSLLKASKGILFAASVIGLSFLYDHFEESFFNRVKGRHVKALVNVNNQRYCSGSDIEYDGNVYFVTNKHCCKDDKFISTNEGETHEVLLLSKKHDVCIADTMSQSGLSLTLNYGINDATFLLGFPRGLNKTLRRGSIFDIGRDNFHWLNEGHEKIKVPVLGPIFVNSRPLLRKYLFISTITYPGNSGSPVLDWKGDVMGLLFAGVGSHTEGLVVPSEYVVDAIKTLERVRSGMLYTKDAANTLNLKK